MSWVKKTVGKVVDIVDKVVPDTAQANELKSAISSEIISAGSAAVLAEVSGNWLQRSWRPITALVFVFLILFNYFIVPLANVLFGTPEVPWMVASEIPEDMWGLLKIMIGGFVLSRGGEKITKTWKNGQ